MAKRKPGRPAKKKGPGRPPKHKGPGRPAKAKGPGRPPKKRGPGRSPLSRGPGRPGKIRGPGRPPKAESIKRSKISANDLGKFIDLQSKILDVQRDVYKRTGKFDLGMHKQFSDNFSSIDKLIENVAKIIAE